MSAVAISEMNSGIGAPMRQKLAGFARTLRDNGYKIGLAETRDALAVLASPAAGRADAFRPALRALFCATHSDWERFDEIFDAYWQGRHIRQARMLVAGQTPAAQPRARRLGEPAPSHGETGLPNHTERRNDGDSDATGDGRGRREGA